MYVGCGVRIDWSVGGEGEGRGNGVLSETVSSSSISIPRLAKHSMQFYDHDEQKSSTIGKQCQCDGLQS